MSHVPGYDPRTAAAVGTGLVSYPSTYQGVRNGTYGTTVGTSVTVPQGNVTYRAQPGAGLVRVVLLSLEDKQGLIATVITTLIQPIYRC